MSRKNPATRIASLTLATLLFFTTAVSAAPGTINATDVKFRKSPNTSAEILDVLDKNTPLEVTGREGDWVSVEKGGTSGYVYATYVTVPETASSETASPDTAAPAADAATTVSRAATELTGIVNAPTSNSAAVPTPPSTFSACSIKTRRLLSSKSWKAGSRSALMAWKAIFTTSMSLSPRLPPIPKTACKSCMSTPIR
jgi:uncharacterized protein YraI